MPIPAVRTAKTAAMIVLFAIVFFWFPLFLDSLLFIFQDGKIKICELLNPLLTPQQSTSIYPDVCFWVEHIGMLARFFVQLKKIDKIAYEMNIFGVFYNSVTCTAIPLDACLKKGDLCFQKR